MSGQFSLGLTGGIGSGKTTIANLFDELGAALIDTDLIAHQLTMPNGLAIPAIREQFGDHAIGADGAMDRAVIRELVFSDQEKKRKLEAILHPLIRVETELAAQNTIGSYPIFVVPLLVESGNWKNRVSRVLVVDCDEEIQVQRVMARNHLSRDQVEAIMRNQATRQQRLAAADDVIVNDGVLDHRLDNKRDHGQNHALEQIRAQVSRLHQYYLGLAQASK